jgi:uncharacterized cupredoxin-like copper-binding protein
MHFLRSISLLLVVALILVAACGDDDGASTTATPEPSADGSATPTEGPDGDGSGSPTAGPDGGSATPTPEPVDTDVDIDLHEFSIDPSRTSARPGTVTFQVQNTGEIAHELLVIDTELGHAELPRLEDNSGADESQLDIVGRLAPVDPGDDAELAVTLAAGNYVLICNLNTDSNSHYLSGMYDPFVVSNDAPQPVPTE